jgi:dUTP pyrophosphatase
MKFARLTSTATLPVRKHASDAGVDVFADEHVRVPPFSYRVVHTGVTCEVPEGSVVQVWPKGRNNHLAGSGIIDAGYQGEILIKVVNYSWKVLTIKRGDAVAQLVHLPVYCEKVEEVDRQEIHHQRSQRGGGGGIHST